MRDYGGLFKVLNGLGFYPCMGINTSQVHKVKKNDKANVRNAPKNARATTTAFSCIVRKVAGSAVYPLGI